MAFDQETAIVNPDDERLFITTPVRYQKDGTGTDMTKNHCMDDMKTTQGELLTSGGNMTNQISCTPNTNNSGNFYSWSASTAGGQSSGKEPNSVCPKGWQLTTYSSTDTKSFDYLIRTAYNVLGYENDRDMRPLPMSFIYSGYYKIALPSIRGTAGFIWSAVGYTDTYAYSMFFYSDYLNSQYGYNKEYGFAVRCVSR